MVAQARPFVESTINSASVGTYLVQNRMAGSKLLPIDPTGLLEQLGCIYLHWCKTITMALLL